MFVCNSPQIQIEKLDIDYQLALGHFLNKQQKSTNHCSVITFFLMLGSISVNLPCVVSRCVPEFVKYVQQLRLKGTTHRRTVEESCKANYIQVHFYDCCFLLCE